MLLGSGGGGEADDGLVSDAEQRERHNSARRMQDARRQAAGVPWVLHCT